MSLFQKIRTKKTFKIVAAFLALNLFADLCVPTAAFALTNGPSQPEVQSFEPVGTTDMVDLFTGDFNYNIPLFELPGPNGGYPFNLSYHSGIGMDQEASWVGLGWNLNPGAIVRGMRGLPDDFNGQEITKRLDRKSNVTFGVGYAFDIEIGGAEVRKTPLAGNFFSLGMQLYYNNYKGIGYSLSPGYYNAWGGTRKGDAYNKLGFSVSMDSQEGIGVSPFISLESTMRKFNVGYGVVASLSSRAGLGLGFEVGVARVNNSTSGDERQYSNNVWGMKGSSSYGFAQRAYTPFTPVGTIGNNLDISFKIGFPNAPLIFTNGAISGFFNVQNLDDKNQTVGVSAYGYNYLGEAQSAYVADLTNEHRFIYDFNREKDGIIGKTSPNLGIPSQTFDYYNVQGQGVSGSFRPYRSEIGRTFDAPVYSWGAGASLGFEPGTAHAGFDGELSFNSSHTTAWDLENEWSSFYSYKHPSQWSDTYADGADIPDPLYYKSLGELTSFPTTEMNYIGGEDAVRAIFAEEGTLVNKNYNPQDDQLENSHSQIIGSSDVEPNRNNRERISRNTTIYPITNKNLRDASGNPVLEEYDVKYYTSVPSTGYYPMSATQSVSRSTRNGVAIDDHVAGITAFNPDGNRYVYGLPVYNRNHYEIGFTVQDTYTGDMPSCSPTTGVPNGSEPTYKIDGTEEFFSKTNLGPYVHSYMLTGILGTDYVDVTGDGISDDDYGYWVKFNYLKAYGDGTSDASANSTSYKWRSPYKNAQYDPGLLSTEKDDKGYIEYGEREMFYLATAETKTHIAVFKITRREDGNSAADMYATGAGSNPYYKLSEIRVYAKDEYAKLVDLDPNNDASVKAIKIIKLKYNYDLCGDVQNNSGAGTDVDGNPVSVGSSANVNKNKGKLTLKEVSFEYQGNSRGSLSPYRFDYGERDSQGVIDTQKNPNYNLSKYDRWGNYKDESDQCGLKLAPYVTQFNSTQTQSIANRQTFKDKKDREMSAWNLRTITLPTGGNITVTYESDDYAYVQHRKATQMFNVKHFYDSSNPEALYLQSDWHPGVKSKRRIYFTLERPVKTSDASASRFFNDYIKELKQQDGNYQLYYKLLMKIRTDSEPSQEFISGYSNLLTATPTTPLNTDTNAVYGYVNSTTTVDGDACYTEGFVTVDLTRVSGTNTDKYHPFAVAAWQHLRTDQPDLLHTIGNVSSNATNNDKVNLLTSLLGYLGDFEQVFKGFRKYCFQEDFGRTVSYLEYSHIRLGTPDEVKYGGGCRVKEIKINDSWNAQSGEASSEYGQTYDYTTIDADGSAISSGVASYEPLIGGEEIPLRCSKHYVEEIPIFTDNDLFFEYPINESNYPAPVVGYSKVTVKSLTTNQIIAGTLPDATRGTGAIVTEFYTAKDFPVITDETMIDKRPFDLYIPIPFIGQVTTNNMTATQGYAIILNDMHGKLKAVTNYGMNATGDLLTKPESKVEYFYKSSDKVLDDGTLVKQLENEVSVIAGDTYNNTNSRYETDIHNAIVGEEYEFVTDQRRNRNFGIRLGVDFNVEIAGLPIPFPWPSFSMNTNEVRTAVTNKIIHKSGILTEIVATDAQSIVTTENKVFDSQTGRPLLVTVTNNYDAPIYRYDIPAYWEYDNMGAAFKNIGFCFTADIATVDATWDHFTVSSSGIVWENSAVTLTSDELYNTLSEGDEYIMLYDNDDDGTFEPTESKYKATLVERREYCDASSAAVKSLVFHTDGSIAAAHKVQLRVVRSGRRNLIGVNGGSIVALQDPTLTANRTSEPLSSVAYTNTSLASEIAQFLNYVIDCNGYLVYKTYNLDGGRYYSAEGDQLFPSLNSVFSSIKIEACEGGFKLIFSYRTPNGNCNQVDCGCIPVATALGAQVPISAFTWTSGTTITIEYDTEEPDDTFTLNCLNLNVTPVLTATTQVLNASAVRFRDFWDYDAALSSCQSSTLANNLYANGKKGIWRPWMDYYYSDERYRNSSAASGLELAKDGVFDGNGTDKKYYFFRWNPTAWTPIPSQWIPNNTITRFDSDGNELENRDILGNYSSARFGYDNTLATALAANSRYTEMYYESVDDPSNVPALTGTGTNGISTTIAHTGSKSIKIDNAQSNKILAVSNQFGEGKKYIISMWVGRTGTPLETYSDATDANSSGFKVTYTDLNGNIISAPATVFKPTGEVIDGWQRIEAELTMPTNTVTNEAHVKIKLTFQGGISGSTQLVSYYDDIRIFPAEGNMVSYVYDPVTFRLSAKLDDNNFATFYYYDEEGSLFLVKQETEKGIATIQEARSHKQR